MSDDIQEALLALKRAAKRADAARRELRKLNEDASTALRARGLGLLGMADATVQPTPQASVYYDPRSDSWVPGANERVERALAERANELDAYAETLEKRCAELRAIQEVVR